MALWSEIEIVPEVDSMPLCSAAFRSATKRIPHRCSRRRFKRKAIDAPSVAGTTGALRQRSPQALCLERMNPPRRSEALISLICHCPCELSGLLLHSFQALLNRSPWIELLSCYGSFLLVSIFQKTNPKLLIVRTFNAYYSS